MLEKPDQNLAEKITISISILFNLIVHSFIQINQHCHREKSTQSFQISSKFTNLSTIFRTSCKATLEILRLQMRDRHRFLNSQRSFAKSPPSNLFSIFPRCIPVDESMTWIASLQNATAHGACATALTIKPANVNTLVATSRVHARAILHATRIVICI